MRILLAFAALCAAIIAMPDESLAGDRHHRQGGYHDGHRGHHGYHGGHRGRGHDRHHHRHSRHSSHGYGPRYNKVVYVDPYRRHYRNYGYSRQVTYYQPPQVGLYVNFD
jgi:hypothetical protein